MLKYRKVRDIADLSIREDARHMTAKAKEEGIQNAWGRLDTQTPHCSFCELGTTCRNSTMGPCRITSRPDGKRKGGVDREIVEMMRRTRIGCGNDAPNALE